MDFVFRRFTSFIWVVWNNCKTTVLHRSALIRVHVSVENADGTREF